MGRGPSLHFSPPDGRSTRLRPPGLRCACLPCSAYCSSTPARAKQLAPRPDGPLTHFASPRGEKCRLSVDRGREQAGLSSTENGIVREVEAVFEVEDNLFSGARRDGPLGSPRGEKCSLLLKREAGKWRPNPTTTARDRHPGNSASYGAKRPDSAILTLFAKNRFDGAQSRLRSPVLLFGAIIRRSVKSACDAKPIMVN